MTRQRIAILTCLTKHPGHYTAAEIFALAKDEYPALSRATVYNTLPILVEEGKLSKIVSDDATAVYDTTVITHAHAVCPVCGKWEDVFVPEVSRVIGETFGDDVPYTLSIQRICKKCKK